MLRLKATEVTDFLFADEIGGGIGIAIGIGCDNSGTGCQ
jgi:hypothetical protein